jgi:hypothetical protein
MKCPSKAELAERYPGTCSNIYLGHDSPDRWWNIISVALAEIHALPFEVKIAQIKAKWYQLRIYYDAPGASVEQDKLVRGIISRAETACEKLAPFEEPVMPPA